MRSTAFILGGVVGAMAMSYWNRNRQTMSMLSTSTAVPSTIKNMIQKNPEVQQAVNEIAAENHFPTI